jgi:hypothetical protein
MSDAQSEIARDALRDTREQVFYHTLLEHLTGSAEYAQLESAAESVDSVGGGYCSAETNLAAGLEQKVEKLKSGDEREWGLLLANAPLTSSYSGLKSLSPFAGYDTFIFDAGDAIQGPIASKGGHPSIALALQLLDRQDYLAYGNDLYLIAMPEDAENIFEDSKVVWLGCNICGQDTLRNREGESREF